MARNVKSSANFLDILRLNSGADTCEPSAGQSTISQSLITRRTNSVRIATNAYNIILNCLPLKLQIPNLSLINTVRAKFKELLINTFMYDLAKWTYIQYKTIRDKSIFKQRYPGAKYIHYPYKAILKQREKGYHSQYGQDYFLWNEYFSELGIGEFIDIGANKPIVNSNSFFFEQQGWTGLAIDPLQHFGPLWLKHRKTPLVCGAVADTIGQETFIEILPNKGWEHALSGFKAHVRDEDLKIYQYNEYTINVSPLDSFLTEPHPVDLIMIDVEGAELRVLKGIDFSVLNPRYLLIENDGILGGCESIRSHLKALGYECVARIAATDDFFVKT